jgi:hypothetical protein
MTATHKAMLRNRSLVRGALVVGWLVGTTVLLQGAFLVVLPFEPSHRLPDWAYISLIALTVAQGNLVAVWAVWGGRLRPWRFVAACVAAVAGLLALGVDEAPPNDKAMWVFVAALEMVFAGVAMFGARMLGVESIDRPEADEIDARQAPRVWFQFSLASLLSWTAAVAVVLAASHYLPRRPVWNIFGQPEAAPIFGTSVLAAFGSVWVSLGTRRGPVRLGCLILAMLAGVVILLASVPDVAPWEFALFFLVQAAYLTGTLWLARLAGYRLAWRRRTML